MALCGVCFGFDFYGEIESVGDDTFDALISCFSWL